MPYSAEISRRSPTCFLFVIDQSGSMNDAWGAESARRKADLLAEIINRLLKELVLRCTKAEGVRDYFHVGVIGYGAQVGPAFTGPLAGKLLAPISQIAEMPARVEERSKKEPDGAGGIVEQRVRFPIWLDPVANNGTPMCRAFVIATDAVQQFIRDYPDCYPPTVIHLTDGESTDGDPSSGIQRLASLSSSDGNALIFNYHLSATMTTPVAFPSTVEQLPNDQYARMLFETASLLTDYMRIMASTEHQLELQSGARGYIFNADSVLVVQALDIGTRVENLR